MQATAQQYLVLELSGGSSAALGWVTAAQFMPSLLLSLFAGAVIDRVPRRNVLLATQITLLIAATALAVTTHLGLVTLPLVMAIAFLSGCANAFDMPARQSMVVDFVPRSDVPNAVALNSLSFNVSRTVGQALFGVVAALGGGAATRPEVPAPPAPQRVRPPSASSSTSSMPSSSSCCSCSALAPSSASSAPSPRPSGPTPATSTSCT
jgi:MFS family permease